MDRRSSFPTLETILAADPDQFVSEYTDIAAINLACAVGLPRAEDLDIPKELAALDAMANWMRRRLPTIPDLYKKARAAGKFTESENVFRVTAVLVHMHKEFGIHYNPDRDGGKKYDATDAGDQFIHGILSKRRTGTCASLPVFAVALGRRLGFPLKLVKVPEHLMFRWEDEKERFNFEYAGDGGGTHDDDYYRNWPVKWDAALHRDEQKYGMWLHSLTPKQEVAKCLESRAIALSDLGRLEEAVDCINAAQRFNPVMPYYHGMRTGAFMKMAGAEGLPFVSMCRYAKRGEPTKRHYVIVTSLFPAMMFNPPELFHPIESETVRRYDGPGLRVPLTCVVSVGDLFGANWWWNFVRDPSPVPTIQPTGQQLRDTLDLFRDRTKDSKRLHVCWTDDKDEPLWVHNIRFQVQK